MKPAEFARLRDRSGLKSALESAVTRHDVAQEAKKGHNIYALGQYLARVDDICGAVDSGTSSLARALYDNFNDLLLTYLEKASGCEVTFGGGAADTGRPA